VITESLKEEIMAVANRYENKKAASIEALKIAQRKHRWVSPEILKDVAGLLGMTPDELGSIATFYSLIFRSPVGRHVIYLCDSISCWVTGCARLSRHFKENLGIDFGQTTGDGRFTLIPICCLGDCSRAPVLMIDEDTFGDVSPESLGEILEKYR